jgi:hypothetical protein
MSSLKRQEHEASSVARQLPYSRIGPVTHASTSPRARAAHEIWINAPFTPAVTSPDAALRGKPAITPPFETLAESQKVSCALTLAKRADRTEVGVNHAPPAMNAWLYVKIAALFNAL